jgi:4-hydroxyphenylpyruvate dioxygenase-like putative hemolysin
MPDLFENPLGLDGFEFIEFSAPEKACWNLCLNAWALAASRGIGRRMSTYGGKAKST